MTNTTKRDWKRRITATLFSFFLAIMLFIGAKLSIGGSFADALQINSGDVGSVTASLIGRKDVTYTDRESIDAFMHCFNSFHFDFRKDVTDMMGCAGENQVYIYDRFHKELACLEIFDYGATISKSKIVDGHFDYSRWAYSANDDYFAPLLDILRSHA